MDDRRSQAERGAAEALVRSGGADVVRALLARELAGVLGTASASRGGHPFASLVPFASSVDGEPLLLLSSLAQHTANLAADPRACLFVHDAAAAANDPRTAARAALLGRARRVEATCEEDARTRYLARHPAARGLLGLDFSLFVLAVDEVHVVTGFGASGWLPGAALRPTA
jgi:putative heme iron utilization protein